ncbi:MAG: hypothetical protein NVSMB21_10330 [Vulcanimicrobiaceae bacterium]
MMLLVIDLSTHDAAAATEAARTLDDYLETLLGAGLLKYRIARDTADASHLVLLEEWTTSAAHAALGTTPSFLALQAALRPLLAAPPRACESEIVAAGVASE